MFSFANVVHLFTHEFAGLRARRFPFFFVLMRSLDNFFFRHFLDLAVRERKLPYVVFSSFSTRTGNSRTRTPVA
jgi:hypothetical protein